MDEEEVEEVVMIPAERVAVLIGKKGEAKKRIEEKAGVKIRIKGEGEIVLMGKAENVYYAKDVIRAIGRGFSPEKALKLLNPDYQLQIIDLKSEFHTENALRRVRGRVIGTKGRIKLEIENATDCYLSIYGHTIAIIGPVDTLPYAVEAVDMILNGAKHSTVLNYLSRARKEIMFTRLKGGRYLGDYGNL